ncbi:MAG TPA: hypothetical protein DCY13_22030 [Verrucomicrobiales bacterium]|nr:hypothetical protein [Verrucomicrobiales bacterium]
MTRPTPDQVDRTNPANKHFTWKNYLSAEGTGAHEFGHSAGLDHITGTPNLMQGGGEREHDNKTVTAGQIETIYKAFKAGQLNQREEMLDDFMGKR